MDGRVIFFDQLNWRQFATDESRSCIIRSAPESRLLVKVPPSTEAIMPEIAEGKSLVLALAMVGIQMADQTPSRKIGSFSSSAPCRQDGSKGEGT